MTSLLAPPSDDIGLTDVPAVTELRFFDPSEHSAATTLFATSTRKRTTFFPYVVYFIVHYQLHPLLCLSPVITRTLIKRGFEVNPSILRTTIGAIHFPPFSSTNLEDPSLPGLKQRRSQSFWFAATEIRRLAVLPSAQFICPSPSLPFLPGPGWEPEVP